MGRQNGFTLIELTITVAIIAILAMLGFGAYQGYVGRAQVVSGLADITPGKIEVELAVSRGQESSIRAPADVALAAVTPHCSDVGVSLELTGEGVLSCTLLGVSVIEGKVIVLRRSSSASWTCEAEGLDARYLPQGCS